MLLQPFLQQCRQHPDALALQEQNRSVSYQQLLQQAQTVAAALQDRDIQPGQPVAIHLDRAIEATASMFGVLLVGACYIPLDLKNPPSRLAFIVADAHVAAVIGHGEAPNWLPAGLWLDLGILPKITSRNTVSSQTVRAEPSRSMNGLAQWMSGCSRSTFDRALLNEVEGLRANGSNPSHQNKEIINANILGICAEGQATPIQIQPDTLAAILYTSGSTGQPRGVALSHGAICAFAAWAAELVNLRASDRIASSTPFFFDLSTFDLYAVLARGASLHFVPPLLTMAPARLSAWLKEVSISGWYTVPSLLAFLDYKGNLAEMQLNDLRFLLFAGEVFPTPALISLTAALPHATLYNFFGPTETNVCCYWPVISERLIAHENIPIGLPAADNELRIQADSGELWVRGSTLASGYWSNGSLQPLLNEQGWYATGDRVSLENGEYRFHGRLGRMLKCSGYRVEPAEIEAVVNILPGIKECAVVGITDPTAGQRPALAVVLESGTTIQSVRLALSQRLPSYMQPSRYRMLDALPRLANGKLDFQKLRLIMENEGLSQL